MSKNLLDRRGFRQTWDICDYETRQEIADTMAQIIYDQIKDWGRSGDGL